MSVLLAIVVVLSLVIVILLLIIRYLMEKNKTLAIEQVGQKPKWDGGVRSGKPLPSRFDEQGRARAYSSVNLIQQEMERERARLGEADSTVPLDGAAASPITAYGTSSFARLDAEQYDDVSVPLDAYADRERGRRSNRRSTDERLFRRSRSTSAGKVSRVRTRASSVSVSRATGALATAAGRTRSRATSVSASTAAGSGADRSLFAVLPTISSTLRVGRRARPSPRQTPPGGLTTRPLHHDRSSVPMSVVDEQTDVGAG
eukprot:CAMPEP_0170748416 /NCGR_PEP_ID=MMETSP0437-20130122/9847_1 /TAXON_ID=0 /ORGANISM="Sexangularia sp." /LENGTH=258 /DNA_ID=CAMNT_0011087265 /DNA_START=26 /DNA_END=799 /DNA_ORIENTATION=-